MKLFLLQHSLHNDVVEVQECQLTHDCTNPLIYEHHSRSQRGQNTADEVNPPSAHTEDEDVS